MTDDDGIADDAERSDPAVADAEAAATAARVLYALPLAEFLPRRTALAASARSSGNRPLAQQISAFRKPTRAAHLINRLVLADPVPAQELRRLAETLRRAERSTDRELLADLVAARRDLVSVLTDRAGGDGLSASAREELANSFRAALADPAAARHVLSGSLVRAVEFDGFGFVGGPDLSVVPLTDGPSMQDRTVDTGAAASPDDCAVGEPGPADGGGTRSRRSDLVSAGDVAADGLPAGPASAGTSATRTGEAGPASSGAEDSTAPTAARMRQDRLLERKRLREQVSAARLEVDAAEGMIEDAREVVAGLEERVARLTDLLESSKAELAEAQRDVVEAERGLTRAGSVLATVEDQLNRLRRES